MTSRRALRVLRRMGLRRQLAKTLERVSGAMIIHPAEFWQMPGRMHLARLFDYLGVDAVFDVGANHGQYATQLRRDLAFRGPIISFEPIPELAADLRRRAAASDPNWFIEELALDREAGAATFNVMAEDTFSSLHRPAGDQPATFDGLNKVERRIEVFRSTLSAQFPKWRDRLGFKRPFLKIDTQGNDLAVVEGAGDLIGEFVGLQSELSVTHLYEGVMGFAQVLDEYGARGFRLSALIPNTAGHFPDLVEMDCILYRPDR